MRKKSWRSILVAAFFSACLAFLLGTVIRSGALFQLDPDELAHAHISYLLLTGFAPFRQFVLIYTPVFHFLMAPVLLLFGFTIEAVESMRWFMIFFFLVRVFVSFFLVRRLFGTRIAVVFLFIFLSDPFTVFSAMQIRPDNLMMLSFTVGLFILLKGIERKRSMLFFWSGFFIAFSGVILAKIVPSLVMVVVGVLVYSIKEKKATQGKSFALGFFFPIIVGVGIAVATSSLSLMFEQVGVYAVAINHAIAYPVPISHFYRLHDPSLFDFYGNSSTLFILFEYLLPFGALLGAGMVLFRRKQPDNVLKVILVGSMIGQSVLLLLVHSVFIQYFLPVSWLWALFFAVAVTELIGVVKPLRIVFALAAGVLFFTTIQTNSIRSHAQTGNSERWLKEMWREIPPNQTVYPNIVFRPIAYPMVYGYYLHDTPQFIKDKLPPLIPTLEKHKVQYIQKTYEWIAMPSEFPAYVESSFELIDTNMYHRKDRE